MKELNRISEEWLEGFMGLDGYMADVTRHGKDAPGGVMEYIIYEAFQVFKEEGIKYGSLGIAPLAGLDEKSDNLVERLLCFVYNHLNQCYGFKDLYRAKKELQSKRMASFLLCIFAIGTHTGDVLCHRKYSESIGNDGLCEILFQKF